MPDSDNIYETIGNNRRGGLNLLYGFLLRYKRVILTLFFCLVCIPAFAADTTLPTGTITINNNAAKTNLLTVTLNLSAKDASGVSKMRFSNDNFKWSAPEPYKTTKAWAISAGDGTKTVYAQYKDKAGNWSKVYSDTIILDSTPALISNVRPANITATTASILWDTDTPATSQAEYGATASYGSKSAYAAGLVKPHTVVLGKLKEYTLYHFRVISKDDIGNTAVSPDYTFTTKDVTPPKGTITINSNAAYVTTANVTLNLTSTDTGSGVSQMQFSNDKRNWSEPEPYAVTKAWELMPGSGAKTVYAKFKDNSGNWSAVCSDAINFRNQVPRPALISPAPGTSLYLKPVVFSTAYTDNNGWQDIKEAYLLINTSSSLQSKCFYGYYNRATNLLYLRNDANTAWLGGFVPGGAKVIENSYTRVDCAQTVVSGEKNTLAVNWAVTFKPAFVGAKNMFLAARDNANAYSGWLNAGAVSIRAADTTPPSGTIKINGGAQYTNSLSVTLILHAQDDTAGSGLSQMRFSNDNVAWSAPENYSESKKWALTKDYGTKTVYVKFKDSDGNWSAAYSASIIYDAVDPVIVISSPQNGYITEDPSIQLQGTVDGVSFSEARALTPGQNVLTKTATDTAGNTASASVVVFYYLGQLIGPEGGEVTSDDGRVKVIIPPGALDKPTRIKVSTNIDKEVLDKFKSSGKNLLSVVKCTPGINFNLPVTIIYTLEQAQVPGTPVVLGIYDGNEISITGDPSFVPEDGVTLTFKVWHFSTYAALQGLISQGSPIGGGVKIPLPDMFTGSFSHSVPITVPPGRKGMQPSLGLAYRSSNSNSWVGVGFSLNPGYIVRSTRLGPPKYNDDDTFYLVTDSGTTELTRLTGKLYQAKIESSFTKFYKEDDGSWRIVSKDGSKLLFGDSADSREVSSNGTFTWYLTEAMDTNGNYITYKYARNEQDNKCYLNRIEYTGNKNSGVRPLNLVEFSLEDREDIFSSYISGSKILTAKRLKQIKVTVDSEPVWTYDLAYNDSPSTGRSQLKSVTQKGADGKALPVQEFEYQQAK